MTGESTAASYTYNGLGDRLQETVNSVTTTFTVDLNTALTQALSDGTNNYVYGLGRIAQTHDTTTEYFLGDALESVRQMSNTSGAITNARAYDPYGAVVSTSGASQSAYGFTGEFTSNDLVYLRARYYAPQLGRFTTRDTWAGTASYPITLNRWIYANGNPVRYTDPSGHSVPMLFFTTYTWSWTNTVIQYAFGCGGLPSWISYTGGASAQYIDVLTLGAFSHFITGNLDYIGNSAYQQGRNLGNSIALTQAMVETTIGVTTLEFAVSSIPPTLGGGAVCEVASGGTCTVVLAPALAGEIALGIGGLALSAHGGAMVAYAAADGGGGGGINLAIRRFRDKLNHIKEHLTPSDLDAARRELAGEVVARRPNGTPYDHVGEVRDAQRGLRNLIYDIQSKLTSGSLTASEINESRTILAEASRLLDYSEQFVP